jgi:putative SOS response-associated peptidase YedK
MCGRFAITIPSDAMSQLFAAQPVNNLPDVPNFNVCPTNFIHVITFNGLERKLESLRWGFVPNWYQAVNAGPLLINARSETVAQKPAFANASRERRCLIPCSGFYEWSEDLEGNKIPWFLKRNDGAPLVFGGVWQEWGDETAIVKTCAIVTTASNSKLSKIHHRLPLVLERSDWGFWLGEEGHGASCLMMPTANDILTAYKVSNNINSNMSSGPDLMSPV